MNKEQAIEDVLSGTPLSMLDEKYRDDKDVVLAAVTLNSDALEYASSVLQDDEEVVAAAAKADSKSGSFCYVKFISNRLRDDEAFLMKNCDSFGPLPIDFATDRLKNKKEFVLEFVYYSGLHSVVAKFRDDKDIVMEALKNPTDRAELKYASKRLRSDKEVVFKAVETNTDAIQYADDSLFDSEEFVIECLGKFPETAEYNRSLNYYFQIKHELELPEWSKDWKRYHTVLAVIKAFYDELSDEYWFDDKKGIIIEAIKRGATLPEEYEDDREMVLVTIQNGLNFIGHHIENRIDDDHLLRVINDFEYDEPLIMEVLKHDGQLLEFVPDFYKKDREAVLTAVKSNGIAYRFASPELRKEGVIGMEAILNNPEARRYLSKELQEEENFRKFLNNLFPGEYK